MMAHSVSLRTAVLSVPWPFPPPMISTLKPSAFRFPKREAAAEGLIRDAGVEIARAREKAVGELRREASDLALQLAGRVLEKKLDAAADRELTDRLIREIP